MDFQIGGKRYVGSLRAPCGLRWRVDGGEALKLVVVFETDEDGWVVASCPTLPGCHSQGRTRGEALANIREAIRGYLASLREHGAPTPASYSSSMNILEFRFYWRLPTPGRLGISGNYRMALWAVIFLTGIATGLVVSRQHIRRSS